MAKIHCIQDNICLSVVHSVIKEKVMYIKLPGGEEYPEKKEVLVKQIPVKKWFKKDGITSVEEYVNSKNKVSSARSVVFDKYSSKFYATYHSASEIMGTIYPISTHQIGFTNDSVYSKGTQIHKHKSTR